MAIPTTDKCRQSPAPAVLDVLTFPLFGRRLIEASAGTGKTYTIASLYLRLLLGHGDDNTAHRHPLTVDRILVLTFTEAATAELRERIHTRIHEARQAFLSGHADDLVTQALLDAFSCHTTKAEQLLAAEQQMDEAAIFTIHGFCQRMLKQHAFESGTLFNCELITDESDLLHQAAADYWRHRFYPANSALSTTLRSYWKTPDDLLADIRPWLSIHGLSVKAGSTDRLQERHDKAIEAITAFKQQWLNATATDKLADSIRQSGVDKRSYSSRNLPHWLEMVSAWAATPTQSLNIPEALERFRQDTLTAKTRKGTPPEHAIFAACCHLLDNIPDFRNALLAEALDNVRERLLAHKSAHRSMSFDDLLTRLAAALNDPDNRDLTQRLSEQYPVAMIDEFQDTDPLQYQIFNQIYPESHDEEGPTRRSGLFMIGDPKQAVYAFRGADIFTYISARRSVTHHYTLSTNWRSTSAMVSAVNQIFSQASAPFIYDQDIPFLTVNPAPHADRKVLQIHGKQAPALEFWLDESSDEVINQGAYEETMAFATATRINQLLTSAQQGQCGIGTTENQQPLSPGDIAILVRTGTQGRKIRKALAQQNIDSVYLGGNSVLATTEAADLQLVLSACLNPTNARALHAALACTLFNLNANQLDQLNHDEHAWEQAVDEFSDYQQIWRKQGVLAMLRQLLIRRRIAEQLLASPQGERRLTDFLHIGELLAAASQEVNNPQALLRWLSDHRLAPDHRSEEQQQHLESDRNMVQIVTVHKSKGLEYNVVFLPFVCSCRKQDLAFYHDDTRQAVLDLTCNPGALEKADHERLAEDLRLLYVALTRPVYTCHIGLAPVSKNGRGSVSNLHRTAIGYLLQGTATGGLSLLKEKLAALTHHNPHIALTSPPDEQLPLYQPAMDDTSALVSPTFKGYIEHHWRVTSYSALSLRHSHTSPIKADALPDARQEVPEPDRDASLDNPDIEDIQPATVPDEQSVFTFPRGAQAGRFLHSLFEQISFPGASGPDLQQFVHKQLLLGGYDETWQPVVEQLVHDVLDCPLNNTGMQLRAINDDKRRVEMAFFLPMARLDAPAINRIIRNGDSLSAEAGLLDFRQVQGMLKGFIDLVFEHHGRYYVLDYKSSHLGYTTAGYSQGAMRHAMIEHRYDFQYQLYTLALHRLLSARLPDYNYETHMGGVFYLFLRGMKSDDTSGNGVFHARPSWSLISQLDDLFNKGIDPGGNRTC